MHKEFVSDKTQPGPASLLDPALDSVLATAGEIGLARDRPQRHGRAVSRRHGDAGVPRADEGARPSSSRRRRSSGRTPASGASCGRCSNHAAVLESMLADPAFANLYFDISWTEVAKYVVALARGDAHHGEADQSVSRSLPVRHRRRRSRERDGLPGRPTRCTRPLWAALSPDARAKVRVGNYERLFDAARTQGARVGSRSSLEVRMMT